jgi:hypothetical protein
MGSYSGEIRLQFNDEFSELSLRFFFPLFSAASILALIRISLSSSHRFLLSSDG